MQDDLFRAIEALIRKAPASWMIALCGALKEFQATATAEFVLQRLPMTHNSDLAFLATEVIKKASSLLTR